MKNIIIALFLITNLFSLNLPKYFSANFTQKIYSQDKILTYKGKIYTNLKQTYWKYTYPNKKEIWVNDKVYIYEPDLIQVTIAKKPKLDLFNAIKKAKKINNDYIAKINNKKIHFIYNNTLQKAWYIDDVGNKVELIFTNQSTKKIDQNLFIPKYPKDVDIIYQN